MTLNGCGVLQSDCLCRLTVGINGLRLGAWSLELGAYKIGLGVVGTLAVQDLGCARFMLVFQKQITWQ